MDTYYRPEHLPKFSSIAEGNKKLADKFFDYYAEVFKAGALSAREKALIALAVSHVVQCPIASMPTPRNPCSRAPTSSR